MKRNKFFFLSGFCLLILFFGACSRNYQAVRLALPSTPIITESKRWGVVNSNFIRLRLRPNEQAEVINGFSKGIILEVHYALKEPGAAPEAAPRWYQVEAGEARGWVLAAQIKTCASKTEAEKLARQLQ